jgi:acyl-CoA thioesterase I
MKSNRACRLVVLLSALLLSREAFPQSRIVAIGDSNTAGYGLARHQAFPARLRSAGYAVQVWKAGVLGDNIARIAARLDRYVPDGIPPSTKTAP